MRAAILAGGTRDRMKSLTAILKPLISVNGIPMIERVIRALEYTST